MFKPLSSRQTLNHTFTRINQTVLLIIESASANVVFRTNCRFSQVYKFFEYSLNKKLEKLFYILMR